MGTACSSAPAELVEEGKALASPERAPRSPWGSMPPLDPPEEQQWLNDEGAVVKIYGGPWFYCHRDVKGTQCDTADSQCGSCAKLQTECRKGVKIETDFDDAVKFRLGPNGVEFVEEGHVRLQNIRAARYEKNTLSFDGEHPQQIGTVTNQEVSVKPKFADAAKRVIDLCQMHHQAEINETARNTFSYQYLFKTLEDGPEDRAIGIIRSGVDVTAIHTQAKWYEGDYSGVTRNPLEDFVTRNADGVFIFGPRVPPAMDTVTAAVMRRSETLVHHLLMHGAAPDVPRKTSGVLPLHIAAWHGDRGIVELLLRGGADPSGRDKASRTALHFVAQRGWQDGDAALIELLIRAGANLEIADEGFDIGKGWTPLFNTLHSLNVQAAKMFIAAGANVNVVDGDGHTMLQAMGRRSVTPAVLEFQELLGKTELVDPSSEK